MRTPTQGELLARYRAENAATAKHKHKRRYQRLIGMGLGGAGIAAALAGLPMLVSVMLWAAGFVSWKILKAI